MNESEKRKVKEGFYFYRNKVYYGRYEESQVSGQGNISVLRPESIRSDHPICENDCAVRLWENHSLLEPEYADLQAMLLKMRSFQNLNTEENVNFSTIERRLSITLPRELKLIYTAINHQEEYFTSAEHFLPLDEMKLIAWIRSNGFYADIHAGAVEESHLEAFGEHLGQIVWK